MGSRVFRHSLCTRSTLFLQELEFQDLAAVLHCVHAFLAAKVASLDPGFMDGQSAAGKHLHSS